MRLPRPQLLKRRGQKADPNAPVTWGQLQRYVRRATLAFAIVFASSGGALFWAQHSGNRSDTEIFQSRIASVHATCTKFNIDQDILAVLLKVSLKADRRPASSLTKHERHAKAVAEGDLVKLRPNDCELQRKILTKALMRREYDKAVPYLSKYPGQ